MFVEWSDALLRIIAFAAEMIGVAVIVAGAFVAAWVAVDALRRGMPHGEVYRAFRTTLARGILLGLEFLVAADIVGTVAVNPTLDDLYVLALIVAIRTFLSFALAVELEGRLPWRIRRDH